jgi:demethylspheroidene O-methyltransferase
MTEAFDPARASLVAAIGEFARHRYLKLRDRLLSSARFQRWAAGFPLSKPIARRRASALFDLCAGFVYSQVVHAAVELGLLAELAAGPRTVDELASAISLSPAATERLLAAACSLRLIERRGASRYGLGVHGLSLVGNPAVARMVEHNAVLYRDLADPVALLRGAGATTELRKFWVYAASAGATPSSDLDVGPYSALMASSLALIAEDILEVYPVGRHECLLDVGGGEGAFLEAAAARAPRLRLVLFDLPAVAERARARLQRAGLAPRSDVVGGDLFRDPLPPGADLAALVRVIHDHDDDNARGILERVRRALRPGGSLLLAEPMAGTRGAEAVEAYFSFYLLAMGQGRPRTPAELRRLLQDGGFDKIRLVPTRTPMLVRLMVARAPPSRHGR